MTQPQEAVGGGSDDTTVIAAEPTIEDRFAALATDEPEEGEEPAPPQGDEEAELTEDDLTDETEADAPDAHAPPIPPPVSWTAEEKEEFKQLPRALQEATARRETEREKFVQAKSQEARQARSAVEQEASNHILQLQTTFAEQIQALLPQIPDRPTHQLQADDPWAYAEQMDRYETAVAQRQWAQQQLQGIHQQQAAAEQAARQQANWETQAVLQEHFPEYLDPVEGAKLRQELGSIALELGYTAEQLSEVDAKDILAMRKVATLKSKADKYDALMAQKMQKVREAKGMPKVSRPGVPQGKGAVASQRYTADRQAMREGDSDAAARVFSRFL